MTRSSGSLVLVLLALVLASVDATAQVARALPELSLGGFAKRYCSALWVSGREPHEALENSVLLGDAAVLDYESGRLAFGIDDDERVVSVHRAGATVEARHFGDQGCVILPYGTRNVFFTPREVRSGLPDARSTPWPMGDAPAAGSLGEGVDGAMLERASETFFSEPLDRRAAFVVVHRGRIVAERYGSGAHRDMQLESWSMGKSMTATLIGRMIEMGHLRLWDPAPVPEWQNSPGDARASIRIADLLRMSSGLSFSGGGSSPEERAASFFRGQNDHNLGYDGPVDVFRFSTTRPLQHPPNTVGRYRNSDPWTLGYVVRRTAENLGEEYLTWPQRELFDRIGIRRFVAETDAFGNFVLTGYNYGTARDWARLGMLYLQRGVWNGERLLPEEFVDFVRSPAPAWDPPVYGGLFWLNPPDENGRGSQIPSLPTDAYNAAGAGDQRTYVIPSRELVIVVMSHRAGGDFAPDRTTREFEALGLAVKAVDPGWTW